MHSGSDPVLQEPYVRIMIRKAPKSSHLLRLVTSQPSKNTSKLVNKILSNLADRRRDQHTYTHTHTHTHTQREGEKERNTC